MKALLLIAATVLSASAFAASDDLKPLGLSKACETKIQKAVFAKCNKDSKDDEAREHGCLLNVVNVLRNNSNGGYFEELFTVTDADEYDYGVSIEDKAKCEFKVVSKN